MVLDGSVLSVVCQREAGRGRCSFPLRTAHVFTSYLINAYLVLIMYFISIDPRKLHCNLLFTRVIDQETKAQSG